MLQVRMINRVSLVVCPVDNFTGEIITKRNIKMTLYGHDQKPLINAEGYRIFSNLKSNKYILQVRSQEYLAEDMAIDLGSLNPLAPLLILSLRPSPAYPFPRWASLIRMSLREADGTVLAGLPVKAYIVTTACARAKVAMTGELAEGEREIHISGQAGRISPGDEFFMSGEDYDHSEFCVVQEKLANPSRIKLIKPLKYGHARGEALLPALETKSDPRGEAVVYLQSFRKASCVVNMFFSKGELTIKKEVVMEEGKQCYLGHVVF